MPNPNEMRPQKLTGKHEEMLVACGFPQSPTRGQQPDLSADIAALRREIAELRVALVPVPSLILTGQQALDEFKRMTGRSN